MDTITHGIVGALVGKALFAGFDTPAGSGDGSGSKAQSSPTARAAIVACTIGAMFPDVDIFAGPLARNPLAIMEWHRNVTHSLVILPLWALLLAALSLPLARWLRWKSPPFWILFGIYAVGIVSHIFLDLITSFGTMVWSPLQYSRPAWDWVFILDFTLTGIALVPQLTAWCYREPRTFRLRAIGVWAGLAAGAIGVYLFASAAGYGFSIWVTGVAGVILASVIFLPAIQGAGFRWTRARWCRVGLATLCAYISLAATAHHKALADVERFAASRHLHVENLAALPLPPTLTHWAGLINTPEGVWRSTFHEPGGVVEHTELYTDERSSPYIEEAKKLRDVQVFLWFARFPVWRVKQLDGQQTAIEISDVRFFREEDPDAAPDSQPSKGFSGIRPRPAGFTFEIIFDALGRVIFHGFREPE